MTAQPVTSDSYCIAADHPSLAGHFPGNPIVPGVVIFGVVEQALKRQHSGSGLSGIRKLKFLQPLLPDENFKISFASIKADKVRFKCTRDSDGVVIAEGNLILQDTAETASQ